MNGFKNLKQLVTMEGVHRKDGRQLEPKDLSIIEDGAIIYHDGKITWSGPTSSIPDEFQESTTWTDGDQHVMTPELVDSHTHLIFAGDRAQEYAMRLNGADYQEIAKAGGGILSTVNAVHEIDDQVLFETCCHRVNRIRSYGIGTIEIKSGYGLSYSSEKKLSLMIDKLKKHFAPDVRIINTFMAAHAVPKGFSTSSQYLSEVCIPLLNDLSSKIAIDFVDIFHEQNYFDKEDVINLAKSARQLGIPLKTHADEFHDNKGALLSCDLEARSCDHLLCTGQDGIEALSKSSTVATLLPGTGFFLGKPQAQARKLLDAGAKVALASDYNPGSCHCDNLLLIASLAAPSLAIKQVELWAAITYNAAHAVGQFEQGALLPGMDARFSLFKAQSLDHITYHWGQNLSKDKSNQ